MRCQGSESDHAETLEGTRLEKLIKSELQEDRAIICVQATHSVGITNARVVE